MPSLYGSVKNSSRQQQSPLLRQNEILSREHNRRRAQTEPPASTPSHTSPANVNAPPSTPNSEFVQAGMKRKRTDDDIGATEEHPSKGKGVRRSPFHLSLSLSQSYSEAALPDAADEANDGMSVNPTIASLPEEAKALLDKLVSCAETPLQLEMVSVILKASNEICARCPSFAQASLGHYVPVESAPYPVASEYSHSEDGSDEPLPWNPAGSQVQASELGVETPIEEDSEELSGVSSVILGEDSSNAIGEDQSQEAENDLQFILSDHNLTNLGSDVGDGDHTAEHSSYDEDFPLAHFATSASEYARYARQRAAALGMEPEESIRSSPAPSDLAEQELESESAPQERPPPDLHHAVGAGGIEERPPSPIPSATRPRPKNGRHLLPSRTSSRPRRTAKPSPSRDPVEGPPAHRTRLQLKRAEERRLADAVGGAGPSSTRRAGAQKR